MKNLDNYFHRAWSLKVGEYVFTSMISFGLYSSLDKIRYLESKIDQDNFSNGENYLYMKGIKRTLVEMKSLKLLVSLLHDEHIHPCRIFKESIKGLGEVNFSEENTRLGISINYAGDRAYSYKLDAQYLDLPKGEISISAFTHLISYLIKQIETELSQSSSTI